MDDKYDFTLPVVFSLKDLKHFVMVFYTNLLDG